MPCKFDFSRKSRSLSVAWIVVFSFLAVFLVFPLLLTFLSVRPADFSSVFGQPALKSAMRNTLLECVCSTSLSVLTGYIFAYSVVKADIPFKRFFRLVPIIHLVTPPFVGGLAFILLFGRQGFITHGILKLNVSLYGFWGLLMAQTLCFFPMAYLICLQTLQGMNTNLEKAARGMGAGGVRIFFTVTLPLSLPAIISSFLFIAVSVLSDFGNPLIVGGRFRVLAVEIYTQLTGWLNVGKSVVLGIILVVPSVVLFVLQHRLSGKLERRAATLTGRGGMENAKEFQADSKKNVGKLTRIFLTVFVFFVSFLILVHFFAIIAGSFQKRWGVNTSFTFEHIKSVMGFSGELFNSVRFALISAFLSTLLASLSSFLVHRTSVPLSRTLDVCSQLPSAIPGSLLGLSLSVAAAKLDFDFSSFLIVVSMTVSFMPFAYRIVSNSYGQISLNLDDSAQSLGSNKLAALWNVIVPLSNGGIFSGFVYDFIRGVGTLSSVIFLVSFNTPLASIRIVNLAEQGDWGRAAALAMVLTFVAFGILGLGVAANALIFKNRFLSGGKKWRFFR